MKYEIYRTSTYRDCPHKDAYQEEYEYLDYRTIPIEQIREKNWGKDWFETGYNHHNSEIIYKGNKMAVRTIKNKRWVIDIEDLLEWVKNLGEDVVIRYNIECVEPIFKIEIYDDYRE